MGTAAQMAGSRTAKVRRFGLDRTDRRNLKLGLLFISPWIFGFVAFLLYPMLYALRLSFTRYSGFGEPRWIGLGNYERMLSDDIFWKSLYNTLYYTAVAVPIGVAVAMVLAMAMNQRVREVPFFRAAFYLPSVLPLFAIAFIFIALLDPYKGLVNRALILFGLPNINWLGDPDFVMISLVLLAQLGAGQPALIFLAGLKGIPIHLYESADLDGASFWRKFWHITLPLMTPVILYDIILGLTLGLQAFTQSYVIFPDGTGGPNQSALFYVYYLYNNMFRYSQMGYAAAMSWVLFIIAVVLAALVFRWSRSWVNYELS